MHFRVSDSSYQTDAWPHRVNYLSSPNITFRGTPTGRADRDSRRAHIERKVDRIETYLLTLLWKCFITIGFRFPNFAFKCSVRFTQFFAASIATFGEKNRATWTKFLS